MIGIVDYGMGNLRSVQKGFERVGVTAQIIRNPGDIATNRKLVLPGVGAFADAMRNLHALGFVDPVKDFIGEGRPFLGICLGLQLLFEISEEDGEHEGLGVLGGKVVRFRPTARAMKVPHMGWNSLRMDQSACALFRGVADGSGVYFVHSYYAVPTDNAVVAASTDYVEPFCSVVHGANVFATQFHPEKSQRVGLKILENFAML